MQIDLATLVAAADLGLPTFARCQAFLLAAPLLGANAFPQRVRLTLALALTVLLSPAAAPIAPIAASAPAAPAFLSASGALILFQEVALGACLGLAFRLLFVAVSLAGECLAQAMSHPAAQWADPTTETAVPGASAFLLLLASLLFLSLDGHLLLIRLLADSLTALPAGGGGLPRAGVHLLLLALGQTLAEGLRLALPALALLLAGHLALALWARATVQRQLPFLFLPLLLPLGLLVLYLGLPILAVGIEGLIGTHHDLATGILRH
jgi:flagellar biosynthetic protein FliR